MDQQYYEQAGSMPRMSTNSGSLAHEKAAALLPQQKMVFESYQQARYGSYQSGGLDGVLSRGSNVSRPLT